MHQSIAAFPSLCSQKVVMAQWLERCLAETLVLVMGSNPSRVNPFLPKVFVTLERLTSVILEQLFERTKVGKQEEDDEEKEEEQEGDPAHKAKQAMSPQGLAHF